MQAPPPDETDATSAVSGGTPPPRWMDLWSRAARRGTTAALMWLGAVLMLAVFAPVIANDRPLTCHELDAAGRVARTSYPLLERLSAVDLVLLAGGVLVPVVLAAPGRTGRVARVGMLLAAAIQAAVTLAVIAATRPVAVPESWLPAPSLGAARLTYGVLIGAGVGIVFLAAPSTRRAAPRIGLVLVTALIAGGAGGYAWSAALRETRWAEETAAGRARAVFTILPHSPQRTATERGFLPPGSAAAEVAVPPVLRVLARHAPPGGVPGSVAVTPGLLAELEPAITGSGLDDARRVIDDLRSRLTAGALPDGDAVIRAIRAGPGPRFLLGTDAFGVDVLTQLIHACRLAISIGLASTGLAVLIGVTLGAVMGYCGGAVDLVISRIVEVFMAVPLLFLLIVAAGVLPPALRGTYTMMAIIGCFTWTGAARFTRAEFLRLRSQDFVQAARALGLPLRSILFRHLLPNGVTPVLVEASFAVGAAIAIEATLSFLGLGPVDQPSWGRLLADAYDDGGTFRWWLAVFPGGAVFLTVLSYNVIGESLRDALDPRLTAGMPHR